MATASNPSGDPSYSPSGESQQGHRPSRSILWYFLGVVCGGGIGLLIVFTSARGYFSDPVPVPGDIPDFQCIGTVKVFGVMVSEESGPLPLVHQSVNRLVQQISSPIVLLASMGGGLVALRLYSRLRPRAGGG
jgi:hypothetical protein